MLETFKSLVKLPVGAVLFLIINILIVSAHIVLPRYLNQPDLVIVTADALVQESSWKLSTNEAAEIYDAVQTTNTSNTLSANTFCLSEIWPARAITESCKPIVEQSLNDILIPAKEKYISMTDAIKNIDEYNRTELVEIFLSGQSFRFNNQATQIFFNLLTADTMLKPEFENDIKSALLQSALALVEQDFQYIQIFESVLARIDLEPDQSQKPVSGVRLAIMNKGYGDGIVNPQATLRIAGQEISLKQLPNRFNLNRIDTIQPNHLIVPSREIVNTFFVIDEARTSVQGNQAISRVIEARDTVTFEIAINTTDEIITKTGTWPSETSSIYDMFNTYSN